MLRLSIPVAKGLGRWALGELSMRINEGWERRKRWNWGTKTGKWDQDYHIASIVEA